MELEIGSYTTASILAIAMSPMPVLILILISSIAPPLRNASMYVAGWLTGLFMLAVLVLLIGDSTQLFNREFDEAVISQMRVLAGLLMLGLAGITLVRHMRHPKKMKMPRWISMVNALPPKLIFLLGFGLGAISPKNVAFVMFAFAPIAALELRPLFELIALVIFTMLSSFFLLIVWGIIRFEEDKSEVWLAKLKVFMIDNNDGIVVVTFTLFGAMALLRGLSQLGILN